VQWCNTIRYVRHEQRNNQTKKAKDHRPWKVLFRHFQPQLEPLPDRRLDLRDIPEATDEQLRRARRVGRPVTGNAKHLIAIRISPRVLARLRRLAAKQSKPYQTYMHELLERAASTKVS